MDINVVGAFNMLKAVAKVMALPYSGQADSLERVLAADRWAREQAAHTIRQLTA